MIIEHLSPENMGQNLYLNCNIPLKSGLLPVFTNGNKKTLELNELYELRNAIDNLIFHMEKNNVDGFDIEEKKKQKRKETKKEKILKESSCNSQGIIYIMKNCGYYKIGRALSETRLGEYTKLPEEPEYIVKEIVSDYGSVELSLHKMFKSKRLRNGKCEWFNLSDEDILKAKDYISNFIIRKAS